MLYGEDASMINIVHRNPRATLAMFHDTGAAGLAWILAYLLRFNLELPAGFLIEMWRTLIWVLPLQVVSFWISTHYEK